MIGAVWTTIKAALMPAKMFGFMWKYRTILLIGGGVLSIFILWQLSAGRADTIKKLREHITLLETVVTEHENAARELEGKAIYEKDNATIAAESAADIAAGRQSGDGPMARVLRAEYERVLDLAKERAGHSR